MGNLYLLPFKQGWENGAFWLLRGVILDIFLGGGAGKGRWVTVVVSFFMILSKIVVPWGLPII